MDIYNEIDRLYSQIDEKQQDIAARNNRIKELKEKIKELQNICFRYSEYAYGLIGALDRTHLDVKEQSALDTFKDAIDSCLSGDGGRYKDYLKHKYVEKDLEAVKKDLTPDTSEQEKEINETFMNNALRDTVIEDDTDTLVIIEKKDDKKVDLEEGMFYNTQTKSFIDNSKDASLYNKVFEESFKNDSKEN